MIAPSIRRFEPELILVSAGFDAHWDDPLAMMRLTLSGIADLSKQLIDLASELCDGKIVFVMEGGYNLGALSEGVANLARLLLGDAPTDTMGAPKTVRPLEDIDSLVTALRTQHHLG